MTPTPPPTIVHPTRPKAKKPSLPPALTQDHIKKLISQLGDDLNRVKSSGTDDGKASLAASLVDGMTSKLTAALASAPVPAATWVAALGTELQDFADLMVLVFGSSVQTGACFYSNPTGCINCTKDQCDSLHGTYADSQDCP